MMAIHGLECKKGLDLILHTPGGDITATESIIDYLHRKFDDIRVIVPQLAMSAGTIIACSAKSILMGKHSSLGPIDPQLRGIPAHGVIEEFQRAYQEISEDPSKVSVWQFILQQYRPTFLSQCENAIELSKEITSKNLKNIMFKGDSDSNDKAKKIVDFLMDYNNRKTHGRNINIDECKEIGLKIEDLEKNNALQDAVLTVHHCYIHILSNTPFLKIIENHKGAFMARTLQQQT